MTSKEFSKLKKRDFENGAVLDEIYSALKEKEGKIDIKLAKEAFLKMREATFQSHSAHVDMKGTRGMNCPECLRMYKLRIEAEMLWKQAETTLVDEPLLTCPFCNMGGFDAAGLKVHLDSGYCEKYDSVKIGHEAYREGIKQMSCKCEICYGQHLTKDHDKAKMRRPVRIGGNGR